MVSQVYNNYMYRFQVESRASGFSKYDQNCCNFSLFPLPIITTFQQELYAIK